MPELFAARAIARACLVLVLLAAPALAATHNVGPGGDLQAALNAAQPGDLILLSPGATYVGNFRLPNKPGVTFITIRTDAPAGDLPAAGVRVTPAHAAVLAKIKSPNTSAALATAEAAHHWRIEAVEFQANVNGAGDIIVLGANQTQASQMPHNLVFDRVYIHGDPTLGQKRGIALNSGYTEILNSHISDIKSASQDAQAICGWNGSGPYLIENNYLEASGENILFGGADPTIADLVPADITIRRNLVSKPLEWRGTRWVVKNAFELKIARRVLVEGNIFENVWQSGQVGFAIVITPRNSGGRAPWATVEDVTFRYNVVRHAAGGINMTGWDDGDVSRQTQRVHIAHNLFHDIDARWGNAEGIFLQIGDAPRDVTVERNTVIHSGTVVNVYGRRNGGPWPVEGFVFRDNLMRHNRYGVIGASQAIGQQTLSVYFLNLVFDRNVLAGGEAARYPAGNYFPSLAEFDASFTNAAAEDFALATGSPLRTWASDGGAVGADVATLIASLAGARPLAPGERSAVCRAGQTCTAPLPRRR